MVPRQACSTRQIFADRCNMQNTHQIRSRDLPDALPCSAVIRGPAVCRPTSRIGSWRFVGGRFQAPTAPRGRLFGSHRLLSLFHQAPRTKALGPCLWTGDNFAIKARPCHDAIGADFRMKILPLLAAGECCPTKRSTDGHCNGLLMHMRSVEVCDGSYGLPLGRSRPSRAVSCITASIMTQANATNVLAEGRVTLSLPEQ